jgi:hypothetical protein
VLVVVSTRWAPIEKSLADTKVVMRPSTSPREVDVAPRPQLLISTDVAISWLPLNCVP